MAEERLHVGLVICGTPPPALTEYADGYLLTGSATSVYDDEPWIADAEDLVRAVVDAGIPLAGVCFGHQLIAQALGGRVEKAAAGWGAGVHTYTVATPLDGLGDDTGTMRLQAMHQDQVLDAPEGAVVWATSDHCPIAGYTVGDAVWTVQAHPEFTAPFATGVIGLREEVFGPDLHARAAATVDDPTDADAVAAEMAAFFRTAVEARAARSATA